MNNLSIYDQLFNHIIQNIPDTHHGYSGGPRANSLFYGTLCIALYDETSLVIKNYNDKYEKVDIKDPNSIVYIINTLRCTIERMVDFQKRVDEWLGINGG